jgi:signal transduction histidine kinase
MASLDTLEKTRDQLVQSEKMAALGGLVAGVAHEINTPVGVGVTAASFLKDRTDAVEQLFFSDALTRSDLEAYFKNVSEVSKSILINMERAASLIQSFKQMAVDRVVEEKRIFNLKKYLQDLLLSLKPSYRNRPGIDLSVMCPENLEVESDPGVFSQVFSNLIMNSLNHGFRKKQRGEIVVRISVHDGNLCVVYTDSGEGMTDDQVSKVFDPFFTTTRRKGGTGLGMSIVYNLISQTLGGTIHCQSVHGEGVTFTMTIPNVVVS